jgi:hypothetical protein
MTLFVWNSHRKFRDEQITLLNENLRSEIAELRSEHETMRNQIGQPALEARSTCDDSVNSLRKRLDDAELAAELWSTLVTDVQSKIDSLRRISALKTGLATLDRDYAKKSDLARLDRDCAKKSDLRSLINRYVGREGSSTP